MNTSRFEIFHIYDFRLSYEDKQQSIISQFKGEDTLLPSSAVPLHIIPQRPTRMRNRIPNMLHKNETAVAAYFLSSLIA
jgi:hypothetical protein